jgi:hypothetical protein
MQPLPLLPALLPLLASLPAQPRLLLLPTLLLPPRPPRPNPRPARSNRARDIQKAALGRLFVFDSGGVPDG